MLYIVRGKNRQHDRTLRVHAESPAEAEKVGWKRGLFVTEVTPMQTSRDYSPFEALSDFCSKIRRFLGRRPLKAWGRIVPTGHALTLVILGGVTWAMDLRALGFI